MRKKEQITYIYDEACKILDDYYTGKNICGFKCNQCYSQYNTDKTCGCCRKCYYKSNKGCTTKNLTCKLFFCSEVTKREKVLTFDDLDILKNLSFRQQIILKHDYFSSREEVIKDLEIGSLTIFVLRFIYRYVKRSITK